MIVIKFRAWIKKEKEMHEVCDLYKQNNNEYGISVENSGDNYYAEDIILMQYTGLEDKNGKEIYEGDIVKYEGENWDVAYCNSYSCGRYELDKYEEGRGGTLTTDCENWFKTEVIGNIYGNPELLKGK